MRLPRWAGSLIVLIGAYVAVMLGAALWLPPEWDWAAWGWLGAQHAPSFDAAEIAIVDVPWNVGTLPADRRRIAAFLQTLAARKAAPEAVILDVQFKPCDTTPCEGSMATARDALVAAIRAAENVAPVFALEQPELSGDDRPSSLDPHDPILYGALSGAGHSRFTTRANPDATYYRACYEVPVTDAAGNVVAVEPVWDVIERVAMRPAVLASAACDQNPVAVQLPANAAEAAGAAVVTLSAQGQPPAGASFDHKYVIVGTIENDRQDPALPGPELLAWALSDALDRSSSAGAERTYDTEPQGMLLLVLVPGFSGLAVVAFTAIFFLLRSTKLGWLRPALPWLSAVLAALAGLAALAAFELWLLSAGHIQPQITLIALGIVLASALASLRAYEYLFRQTWTIEAPAGETYDYDVFISYAHEEGAWVFQHVYVPLRDARLPDGRKLNIFFDTDSIQYAAPWQEKITLSLQGSRIVVPVYSETYFSRPYCKFEIMRAHLKWITAGMETRCVLPIMRGKPRIPPAIADIQATSLDDDPELIDRVVAEIVERIARLGPPAEAPAPASAAARTP